MPGNYLLMSDNLSCRCYSYIKHFQLYLFTLVLLLFSNIGLCLAAPEKLTEVASGNPDVKLYISVKELGMGTSTPIYFKAYIKGNTVIYGAQSDGFVYVKKAGKVINKIEGCSPESATPARFLKNYFAMYCSYSDQDSEVGYTLFDYEGNPQFYTHGFFITEDNHYFYYNYHDYNMRDALYIDMRRIDKSLDGKSEKKIFSINFDYLKGNCLGEEGNILYLSLFKKGLFYFKVAGDYCSYQVDVDLSGKIVWERQR